MRAQTRSRRDRDLAELARRQHGVVSRAQLLDAGVGRAAIGRRIESGHLHRLHRGVYALGHTRLTDEGHWMAAVLAAGPGAALSHRTAGAHWDLITARGAIEVTAPRKLHNRQGRKLHHRRLSPDELTTKDGIPVTTVARTLFDLASVLPQHRLERAMNEAEFRRYGDALSLPSLIAQHPGARGTRALREVLAQRDLGEIRTRKELELRFLALLERAQLPRPEINAPLKVSDRWIEADCLWRAQRLIAELDGRAAHATVRAFESDRLRDRRLQAAGWNVVRITWRQLHDDPRAVAADLRAPLRGC
jgi:hypothetical protein